MKTVLFAIAMRGLDSKNKSLFEEKTIQALKLGSRDFVDVNYSFCDYKEGLVKACNQYMPDCLVVNENLIGNGNIFEIIKDIKSDYPDMTITVLLTKPRVVGDVVLANLTASGIYNWIVAPWTPEAVANSLIIPKKMKDVQAYIPKIVEGINGLAFETKVVEKIEDNLDDLSDILEAGSNNAVSVDGKISDIGEKTETKQNIHYKRVINPGFGFGKNVKPILNIKTSTDSANENNETMNLFSVEQEPVSGIESDKNVNNENANAITLDNKPEQEAKEFVLKSEEKPTVQDFVVQKEQVKEEVKRPLPPRVTMRAEISSKEEMKAKLENAFAALDSVKAETPKEEVKPSVSTVEPKKADDAPLKAYFEKEVKAKKAETKPQQQTVTLANLSFVPKYKKILFIRALPMSSIVPVHVAKLMNASFVDFNKTSNNDGYMDILRTTIKEARMPEDEYIVGDVVAGNGVEKLVDKFDHVVALLPDDPFAIKQFVSRYPNIYNGAIIDKCTSASITRKQLLSMIPDAMYIDSIKVDNCNREVVQSSIDHSFLFDNADYAEGIRYFLKDISGGN